MKDRALLLLAVVLLTHYGYQIMADGTEDAQTWASWWFYVLRGLEGMVLCYLLLQMFPGHTAWSYLGTAACWIGMFEEGQTMVCGLLEMGVDPPPLWSGLCVERFGVLPYMALFAACVVALIRKWGHRSGHKAG